MELKSDSWEHKSDSCEIPLEFNFRYRIGPYEVESALIEHPGVAESAAVSSPDKVRGAVSRQHHSTPLSIKSALYICYII